MKRLLFVLMCTAFALGFSSIVIAQVENPDPNGGGMGGNGQHCFTCDHGCYALITQGVAYGTVGGQIECGWVQYGWYSYCQLSGGSCIGYQWCYQSGTCTVSYRENMAMAAQYDGMAKRMAKGLSEVVGPERMKELYDKAAEIAGGSGISELQASHEVYGLFLDATRPYAAPSAVIRDGDEIILHRTKPQPAALRKAIGSPVS